MIDLIRTLRTIYGAHIEAEGLADAGSNFDSLVDAARLEANNYWDGLTLMMVTGNNAGLTRPIVEYLLGVSIQVSPAFPNAIAAGDRYFILSNYHDQVYLSTYGAVSDAGPAITDFDTDLAEATNDHYNGMLLLFLDGPNAGQAHIIDDYIGASKNVSFKAGDQWTDVPVNGNKFVILPSPGRLLQLIISNLAGTEVEGTATPLNAFAGVATSGDTGADVLTIATTTRIKVHALMVQISGLTAGATATIRMYTKALDADVALTRIYRQFFTVGTDPDLVPVIDGTIGIRNDLRVEIQSNNAADVAVSVKYHAIYEVME